ncbi:MAG: hypothetical protein NZ898_12265 [Myxococcota bacterium]|nr:hypothetical protein [Myxococcota bacterium]MDW8363257.1 hypothetical protein [Myxococcales bacterium]
MRRAVAACSLFASLASGGCPREPEVPARGPGQACERLEDCNDGARCGALRLCIDGRCEQRPSLERPCR